MKASPIAATFSKDPEFWGAGFYPTEIVSAMGAQVKGNDGKYYVDWVCGLGALILGHNPAGWSRALEQAVSEGIAHSLPHRLERQVAEKLAAYASQHVPGWAELPIQVRFGLTGSDVCAAAVMLARAATGRPLVIRLVGGYHGWHLNASAPNWGGLTPPEMWHYVRFNELGDFDKFNASERKQIAAVIIEQGVEEPNADWYPGLRAWCDKNQSLLIMDEVVTGFRFALGGASAKYGAKPDLVCFGKALGNGVPIGALVAPAELMGWFGRDDPLFALSNTGNGNTLGLAAANYVLDTWEQAKVDYLWEMGTVAMRGLGQHWTVKGHPVRYIMEFSSPCERAAFIAGMRDEGHLCNRPFFVTTRHHYQQVEKLTKAAAKVRAQVDALGSEGLTRQWAARVPRVLFANR